MDINYLLNFGVAGGVLYWFMTRFEARMKRVEEALDRQTRATVLDIMTRPTASKVAKAEAHKIASEINARKGKGSGDSLDLLDPDDSKT